MGVKEQKQFEKQMGCMSGILHIFDRHPAKRIYSVKTLTSSTTQPEPETNSNSPLQSTPEIETPQPQKLPLPVLPVFDFKDGTRSSWKFTRETPRLSLDSRAIIDAKGTIHPKQEEKPRRSTSVVAKLMGLEDSELNPTPNPESQLQRSASESRLNRDPHQQYRFFDTTNFQLKQYDNGSSLNDRLSDPNAKSESMKGIIMKQNKCFYDSTDFFPAPKQSVSVSGEIEKRLKMRGIHEPSKDLDTLKQILEALQLKGLLHSKKSTFQTNYRNYVIENENDSPIVVMKSGRSLNRTGWTGNDSPPPVSSFRSKQRSRPDHIQAQVRSRNNANSPTRSPNRVRKVANVEKQRKVNDVVDHRRVTPVHSSRNEPNRSRTRKLNTYEKEVKSMAEDESSTVSDSSFSTDTEVSKIEYLVNFCFIF